MEHYYSLNNYLREKYGEKVYKLAIDSGLSCPNRDGTLDTRGCIFCSSGGSGDFSCKTLEEAKAFLKHENSYVTTCDAFPTSEISGKESEEKNKNHSYVSKFSGRKYIAYYQSYSNTYAPVETLKKIFQPALDDDEIVALAIATRPDCLPPFILDYLYELNQIKPIWVELGLQTIHPETAAFIRRDYSLHTFEAAVKNLRLIGADVVVHLILGLPGESKKDMLESVRFLNTQDIQGVKLHLLHVLDGTDLGEMYKKGISKELNKSTGIFKKNRKCKTDINDLTNAKTCLSSCDFPNIKTNSGINNSLDTKSASNKTNCLKNSVESENHIAGNCLYNSSKSENNLEIPKVPLNDFLYYEQMSLDEYADLICDCIGNLRPDIVIHRLTGDGPKKLLLAPMWSGDKKKVLNTINKRLDERGITQGCFL